MSDLLPIAVKRIAVMRRHGIVYPTRTLWAARRASLPLPVACAILEQETAGGENIFGHDPTIFAGAGKVTRRKYRRYKKRRIESGNRLMQGVGPTQLTWWETQDDADRIGGCWRPVKNMLTGFRLFATYLKLLDNSIVLAGERYNGAHSYGVELKTKADRWRDRLP